MTVNEFGKFVKVYNPNKFKLGRTSINTSVSIKDIIICSDSNYLSKDFVKEVRSIQVRSGLEKKKVKSKTLYDKVIVKFNFTGEKTIDNFIKHINQKTDKKASNLKYPKTPKREMEVE